MNTIPLSKYTRALASNLNQYTGSIQSLQRELSRTMSSLGVSAHKIPGGSTVGDYAEWGAEIEAACEPMITGLESVVATYKSRVAQLARSTREIASAASHDYSPDSVVDVAPRGRKPRK